MSQSPSILVVDDDGNAANMLSLLLSAGNFERITLAANADEAFELLDLADDAEGAPPRFDVIMLDVMMPETDGIEAVAGNFGPDYPDGIFLAQDGDNAPRAQNFKLVRWDRIAEALGL